MMNDFGDVVAKADSLKRKAKSDAGGQEREYLKIYETLPCQLLNVYGIAKYHKLTDEQVWGAMCEPQKTGAKYMTEYASETAERRGVAINRWLQPVLEFCQYQKSEEVQKQNQYIMQDKIFKEMYAEIAGILPALEYCLAPKKDAKKKGASMLRSSGKAESSSVSHPGAKDPVQLDKYAKELYEWMDLDKPSRIRMLLLWQGAGGLPYVASVHHRATQCFKYAGNSLHGGGKEQQGITLEDWQAAVKERHRVGSSGIESEQQGKCKDFDS